MNTLHIQFASEMHPNTAYLFMNCHSDSIKDALNKELRSGYAEFSFYQNLMDNMGMPEEIEFDIEDLMGHWLVRNAQTNKGTKGPLVQIAEIFLISYGYDTNFRLHVSFTKDPITLAQLDYSDLQAPGITNVTGQEVDKITVK